MIECILVLNKDTGLRYIDRKHIKANNEVNWQDPERANYRIRRNTATRKELIKTGITKFVMELDLPDEMKEAVLGHGYVTTFFRVITSKHACDRYHYSINEDGEFCVLFEQQFRDELKVIINDILNKQTFSGKAISSRTLNRKESIDGYLVDIDAKNAQKVDIQIAQRTDSNIFGEKTISIPNGTSNNKQRILPKSTNRCHLIPTSCRLLILEPKINNIYRELRDSLVIDDSSNSTPNAVGVLFRVFIEVSIDYYLKKEGRSLKADTKLAGKITECCNRLETQNIATKGQLHNMRQVATDPHDILNINNFHDYVHSTSRQPLPSDLKLKWDNLQEFFQIMWLYLYKKEEDKNK